MKKCLNFAVCGTMIQDNYEFCFPCVQTMKAEKAKGQTGKKPVESDENPEPIVKALKDINKNLYAMRTIMEYELEIRYSASLIVDASDPKKPRFKIKDLKE